MARRELVFSVIAALFCVQCAKSNTAVLLTDRPEAAFYAQYYNSSQSKFKVEVRYIDSAEAQNAAQAENADMIIARYLDNDESYQRFDDLDVLFSRNYLRETAFYPELAALGRRTGKQFFLPVSFNLPALVFLEKREFSNSESSIIELQTARDAGIAYNVREGAAWSRVGFSPLWDKKYGFLLLLPRLFGADFNSMPDGEGRPLSLAWNEAEFNEALSWTNLWIKESTGSTAAEEDFFFKYFFDPPAKLLTDERILFAYMQSDEYFIRGHESFTGTDFRWLGHNGKIPVLEDYTAFAIYKKAGAKKAAMDFARWFFNEDTQSMILEQSRETQLDSSTFGIMGGFSSLWTVTGFLFPKYYEDFLGHFPPQRSFTALSTLPANWPQLRAEVLLPCLIAEIRDSGDYTGNGSAVLSERLAQWRNIKKGQF
ncbi:MAG: hypothetical protein LBC77_00120 [Spirochaetaceae bacterium]|nr:hypothetical protein [Spirochaetaceae bacterium]